MQTLVRPKPTLAVEPVEEVLAQERGLPVLVQSWLTSLPVALGDMAAIAVSALASHVFLAWIGWSSQVEHLRPILFVHAPIVFLLAGLYPPISLNPIHEVYKLTVASAVVFAILSGVAYVPGAENYGVPFVLVLLAWVFSIPTLPWVRTAVRWLFSHFQWWGMRAIVVGRGDCALDIIQALRTDRQLALRPVAVLPPGARAADLRRLRSTWGIFGLDARSHEEIADWIGAHTGLVARMFVVTPFHAGTADVWSWPVYNRGLSGVLVESNLLLPGPRLVKRLTNLASALLLGLMSLPLILVIAVLVRLSSKGPIFYGHERIGHRGQRFKVWKFRTMVSNADRVLDEYLARNPKLREEWRKLHKLTDDPRITPFGRLLRKTSLDELPQIWNVIRGDMSLVGPRPIVDDEIEKYGEVFDVYTQVTPGVTGLWQVSGRNSTTYDKRVPPRCLLCAQLVDLAGFVRARAHPQRRHPPPGCPLAHARAAGHGSHVGGRWPTRRGPGARC